jgi:signal transduction histidine kinase
VVGPDSEVDVRVVDRGIGISPDDLGKLFRPFSRLRRTGHRAPGAGLGLYVSRACADAMRAEIGVATDPGRGSTFWLRLPAGEAAPTGPSGDPALSATAGGRLVVTGTKSGG